MDKLISLSTCSKKLLRQVCQVIDDPMLTTWNQQGDGNILQVELVTWLKKKKEYNKQIRFLLESLRAALLEDLDDIFLSQVELNKKKEEQPVSWAKKALFVFLAVAGTLVAVSEGFDAIASILGSFAAVPMAVLFLAGIGFSLLSVGLFYFVDLIEISKTVGVKLGKSTQLLDIFLKQIEQINKLKKHIDDCYADEATDANKRQALQQMLAMLISRYDALDKTRQAYLSALNSPALKVAKFATAAITAMFFFGGGFFAGQTLALAIAGLFVTAASATFWPVVVASTMVGLAALSLYWFVQRPALDSIVGHWMGLDKERVDVLVSDEVVSEERLELHKLASKVARFDRLTSQLEKLTRFEKMIIQSPIPQSVRPEMTTRHHMFFNCPRSHSMNDLADPALLSLGIV